MAGRIRGLALAVRQADAGRGAAGRALLGLAVALGCGVLLWDRLWALDGAAIWAALGAVPGGSWMLALAATALSFWAVGRHDETMHRHLETGVPSRQARRAGFCAIALSQMVGLGLVSGALIRWRMLPDQSLAGAARLTLAVSLAFLAGWAAVTAGLVLACWALPWQRLAGVALAIVIAACLMRGGRMPNLYTVGRVLGLVALDCGAATLAFWLLLPDPVAPGILLPAMFLALGAGLVSGTPGGVGAFEVTLFALLPGEEGAGLIAAVLAWRAVYFAVPSLVAAGLAILGPGEALPARAVSVPEIASPGFAEAGLIRQRRFVPLRAGQAVIAVARTPHALVVLRAAVSGCLGPATFADLKEQATSGARSLALYKIGPRLAVQARRAGFRLLPVAREAWLCPADFRLEAAACAGLRRKLRRAAAAGVSARAEAAVTAELARLNADWVAAHGAAHGFSMGRFQPGYVAGQRVYVARVGLRPVGFASFHIARGEWVLDLLRPHPEAPDGTAHALIAAAIADALRAGVPRLSLAAVPALAFAEERGLAARAGRLARVGTGLWQFKAAFAPRWERLYLAAPGWTALALAAWDIRRAVVSPGPLPDDVIEAPSVQPGLRRATENEIAPDATAWQRKAS